MNHLNTLLLMVFLCLGSSVLLAQRNCGSMDYLQQQIEEHEHREDRLKAIEKHTARVLEQPDRSVSGTITIPVVVHVVYRTSTENISAAQIASQIQVLNEDFRRLNADASNTPSVFQGVAADVEVEFCLASSDPQGNPTDGITRTSTTVNGFGTNNSVKFNSSGGKDAWPASDYLNIWVCNIGGGILGYAQFPGGPANTDGVVVGYQYFGTIGTATAPFNLGRTGTHEVGHYLNLRHIWGDGNCNADDFVGDTPRAGGPNYTGSPCTFPGPNSCNEGSGDLPDMFQNYMDYSDDGCMNLFTAGQTDRMRALFAAGGARASLLNSAGCGAPAPPTCDDGIQNGNETGVDCGGPDCAPCPCNDSELALTIVLDNYPGETTWNITDASNAVVASGGPYSGAGSTVTQNISLGAGDHTFTIFDSYGDGICCAYGNGSYSLVDGNGSTVASGGSFSSSESTNFCTGGTAPTCNDGVQNGSETGVDCGGPDCAPCPTCNDGIQNGDETGVDCGGSDCAPCPTCNDGIQNGNETGVDCGGPDCAACPTCNDGIQNGDETGVDCGGPDCAPCATCNDGIQNGNETGVDCGGPDCAPCNTSCDNGSNLSLTIVLDNYPGETTWTITNSGGSTVASGGPYSGAGSTVTQNIPLPVGNYTFTILDSYGDGICCSYGNGSYSLQDEFGNTLASGGQFGASESTAFCTGSGPAPTCNDGIQNGNETGVDCGGPDCAPCATCNDGIQNGNETGVDCGGPDCAPCPSSCNNGNDLTLTINFDNYPQETTWNIVSSSGSTVASGGPYPRNRRNRTSTFSIPLAVGDYTFNIFDSYGDGICCSFGNGFYTLSDNLGNTLASGGQFGSSESTPFCTGNGGGARMPSSNSTASIADINLFPNPTSGELTLAFTLPVEGPVEVLVNSVDGRVVLQQQWTAAVGTEVRRLDASQLAPGLYFLHLKANQQHITRKFVVVK